MKKHVIRQVGVIILSMSCFLMFSCGTPEQNRNKFFSKGKAHYTAGDYVGARLELKNAVQIDPKFADGYFMLGKVMLASKDAKSAFQYFRKAESLSPGHRETRLAMARLLLGVNMAKEAGERIEALLGMDPKDREALLLKVQLLLIKKSDGEAKTLLDRLLAEGVSAPEAYFMLAAFHARRNETDHAEKILVIGVSQNPDSVRLMQVLAKQYLDGQRYQQAIDLYKNIIRLEPDEDIHQLALAKLFWLAEKRDMAASVLNRLIATDPGIERKWLKVANFYAGHNDDQGAKTTLTEGLKKIPESIELRFALGGLYMRRGDTAAARRTYLACLGLRKDEDDPSLLKARTALANVCLTAGDIPQASAYVEEVLKKDPENAQAQFIKGRIYLIQRDGNNAVAAFRAVVDHNPDFILGHLRLAEAHALNQDLELAVDTLKKALKIAPRSDNIQEALVRTYLIKRDFTAAKSQLETILEKNPQNVMAGVQLGDLLLATKAVYRAEKQYRELIRHNPDKAIGYQRLARSHLLQNEAGKAQAVLLEGYEMNPDSNVLLKALVQAHLAEKNFRDAMDLCEVRIRERPEDPFAYNLMGLVEIGEKHYDRAETSLLRAVDLRPEWPDPHNNLALLYLAQNKRQEALGRYKEAIDLRPDHPTAYMALGAIYEQLKQFDAAKKIYTDAMEKMPNHWGIINNMAFISCETASGKDELKNALTLALKAQNLNPDSSEVIDTLGWLYYKLGDYPRARSHIESVLKRVPDSPVTNYHMAAILIASGQTKAARARLETALNTRQYYIGMEEARALLVKLDSIGG
jgi:tetratricopeptide (TPR) repeat protein